MIRLKYLNILTERTAMSTVHIFFQKQIENKLLKNNKIILRSNKFQQRF